ncbi:GNAT family N-acetyltransferase [Peptococcaceae bacterium]|nr:GNAT family N-acetyltransferase [Peptococcaceae bacterium]
MAQVEIRPLEQRDAARIAELYNRYGFGPGAYGYPLTAADIARGLIEKGTILFLVAVHENDRIVATMSFNVVSGQKAVSPGVIWGGGFFIHPEFRLAAQIPAQLFTTALRYLVDAGYYRIDTEILPTNSSIIALYKRVGFHRTTLSQVDGDDYLEMVNYVPYLAYYFKMALKLTSWDAHGLDQGWKKLISALTARSQGIDSKHWHGGEVVQYRLTMGSAQINCLIDVHIEKMTSIDSNIFLFECYPLGDRRTGCPGEEIKFFYRYTNTSNTNYRLSITRKQAGEPEQQVLAGIVLKPTGQWQQELSFSLPDECGRLVIENNLYLEEILPDRTNHFHFPVSLWVEVKEKSKE